MKKRILIVCDDPTLNTGYARVGRFVAQTLHDNGDYQIRYVPCNASMVQSNKTFPYLVDSFDSQDRYNSRRIADIIISYKPSLVLVLGEFQYVGYIGNVCRQLNVRALYYMPVEGKNYPPHIIFLGGGHIDFKLTLMKFYYIVAYSEFGKSQIHKQMPGIVTDTIPHPVNTDVFRPLNKEKCLEIFFPSLLNDPNLGKDKVFIVGAVCRNMRRKGVDYIFKGFKNFIDVHEKPDVKKAFLFLTMDTRDPGGYNLESFIEQFDLHGRVIINPVIGGKEGPEDNQLAEIYNTFDVHLCPFRGEGAGLPHLESIACGVRTLVTDYATPKEYGKDVYDYIPVAWTEPIVSTNCEWAVLNPADIGAAIAKIYFEEDTKKTYMKGVARARTFCEERVGQQWLNLLKDLNLQDMPDIDAESFRGNTVENIVDDYFETIDS